MKKLSLVALRSDAEKLVRDLTYIRSVELKPIDTPPDGLPAVLPAPVFSTESSEKKLLVDTALKLTEKYRTKKKPDTELDRTQLEDKERHVKAIDAARRVLEVDSEMKRLASEKACPMGGARYKSRISRHGIYPHGNRRGAAKRQL